MERFEGFASAGIKFWKALAKNQSRDWFQAHKDEFEEGWNTPMKLLLAELREALDAAYPHAELEAPKVFRIFRDVRFSKDKSPYKTSLGGYVPVKQGKRTIESPAAIYVQVGLETFMGAGQYMMEAPALAAFRAAVVDDKRGAELAKMLAKLEKKGFTKGGHDALKRVPKGFDPEHPRAELLKIRGLTVGFPDVPKDLLSSRKLVPFLVKAAKEVAPMVEWLTFATA